jgi:DNA mismatch repair protein MutS
MCAYYNQLEYGIVYSDISTGETNACLLDGEHADTDFMNLLNTIMPAELLVNTVLYRNNPIKTQAETMTGTSFTPLTVNYFNYDASVQEITRQLTVYSMQATGIQEKDSVIKACGALFAYLKETQKNALQHINKIIFLNNDATMHLDYSTKRNLELTETIRGGHKKGSLLWVLDHTVTGIGGRTLKKWISEPLLNSAEITRRQETLQELTGDIMLVEDLQDLLKNSTDIQRLCARLSYRSVSGKDLLALRNTLNLIPRLRILLKDAVGPLIKTILNQIYDLNELVELIETGIDEECSNNLKDGNLIRAGFDEHIDELKNLRNNTKSILMELEQSEREKSGIKNLKIKYNKVFGYYIEVTKSNLESVPDYFIRKQTLVNAERFYTPELKEIEIKLLNANEDLIRMENEVFDNILRTISEHIPELQETAKQLGILDALTSMAYVSYKNQYTRPYLNDDGRMKIVKGRHPVVEQMITGEHFIPNDTDLNMDEQRMAIITGPNMAGKSTYIRQVAIIALMNQIGCFVPCEEADLCVVDRIFTRVGASDDLASGQSTFMVEMSEVSNILQYATKNSLVILDEVGRGTSTFDGLSIAWAVAEFLNDKEILGCKTLFATHYHELTELEQKDGIVNYTISLKRTADGVIFLHKITKGCSDQSYGIEVAKLAGLPEAVVERSEEILAILEEKENKVKTKKLGRSSIQKKEPQAENLLNYKRNQAVEELKNLPLYELTPIEVMRLIEKIQKELMDE